MATVRERHEQQFIMQQMAALAAGLGGLTNLGPLLATQQQANSELSSLCSRLGDVVTRVDARDRCRDVATGAPTTTASGAGIPTFCSVA